MSKFVGYGMLVVAAAMAALSWMRMSVLMTLADAGVQRQGAVMEIVFMVLCGVILPIGISAILLKKS